MSTARAINGPGNGLPLNQNLYPSTALQQNFLSPNNVPIDAPTNRVTLAPGDIMALPRGDWLVDPALYGSVWYLDPNTGEYTIGANSGYFGSPHFVSSDGFNVGIANFLGCPIGAVVTAGGTNYVQATTTITPSEGNSSWSPIIGGALSVSTIANAGGGYGVPPIVLIPAPPNKSSNANGVGGIPASAYAVLTGGSVTGISWTNQGAGYPSAPTPQIVPSPVDPNLLAGSSITTAAVTLALTGSGTLTGAICNNPGETLPTISSLTLSIGGVGSGATLSAVIPQIITAISVSAAGAGYSNPAKLTTTGGIPAASANTSPTSLHQAWLPRPADISLAASGGSIASISTLNDGGFFAAAPSAIVIGGAPTTAASIVLTMGTAPAIFKVQQLD